MEGMQTVDTQSASTSRRQTWLAGSDVSWTFVFFTSQELGQGQDRLGRVRSPLQELVHLRHILEPKTPKRTGKGMIAQYCPNMQNKSSDELPHFHARWLQICIAQPLSSHLLDELLRQTSPTPCGERSKIYNKNKVQTNPQMHLDVSRVSTSFSSYASIRWPSVCYFSFFASSWAGHILANRRQWRGLSSNRHRFLNCSMACTSWSIIRVIRHSAIGHDWTEVLWSLLCYSCLSLKSHSNLQIFAVIFRKRLLRGC